MAKSYFSWFTIFIFRDAETRDRHHQEYESCRYKQMALLKYGQKHYTFSL